MVFSYVFVTWSLFRGIQPGLEPGGGGLQEGIRIGVAQTLIHLGGRVPNAGTPFLKGDLPNQGGGVCLGWLKQEHDRKMVI